jgi:hypothetical protein
VWAKKEARESHFMLPGMQESVKKWTLTFSNLQRVIARAKTYGIENFLISLKSF